MNKIEKIKKAENAFVDTGSLLHSFAIYINSGNLVDYLVNGDFEYYTFEKCIYEVQMAIRGVGGKKPDEGRGDWAQRHLQGEDKPKRLDGLASKYHDGGMTFAHYWVNHIEEAICTIDVDASEVGSYEEWMLLEFESIKDIISNPDWDEFKKLYSPIFSLIQEKSKFKSLLIEFEKFLELCAITVISYHELFHEYWNEVTISSGDIGWFGRNATIPSEDLEIVMCAVLIEANVFITSDLRLKRCMYSLGDNVRLHASNAIHHKDFSMWIAHRAP